MRHLAARPLSAVADACLGVGGRGFDHDDRRAGAYGLSPNGLRGRTSILVAAARLAERVTDWAEKVGVEPKAVLIREPKRRWGSCDAAGNVRFNWRIVQAPMKLVDYVVAHELVHLVHEDHGREFWGRLGRVMPDYEERREGLRSAGVGVVW